MNHLNILPSPKKKPSADVMYEIIYSTKTLPLKAPPSPLGHNVRGGGARGCFQGRRCFSFPMPNLNYKNTVTYYEKYSRA
jgi:hypothetical protein